jgi:LysR family transcriptional regulator, regulator of abg operon
MKLEQLQHLTAIVEHGGLRAAARRLGMAQPALTRSVRSLERELGVELFVRQSTGMVLTLAGQRLHRRAAVICNESQRALDEIAQDQGAVTGRVSAALSIAPHMGLLPHALGPFRQRYPGVSLQIIEGLLPDVEAELRDGRIDFYLGAAPAQALSSSLQMQHLAANSRLVVGRRGHPLAKARSLAKLSAAEWATTAVDYNAEADLQTLFAQHRLAAPKVVLHVRSALTLMVALTNSDLLALLPLQWGSNPMTRDLTEVITVREHLPAPPIVIVRRSDLPLTPAAEFLADVLVRGIRSQAATA